jgi:hypothetical protein
MAKPIWHNAIEEEAFRETTCLRCFQPDQAKLRAMNLGEGCPHLIRAAANKMPAPWIKRRGNDAVLGKTYKCADFLAKPPVNRRGSAPADTAPMFEPDDAVVDFVPIEGWPTAEDFGRKMKRETDHQ